MGQTKSWKDEVIGSHIYHSFRIEDITENEKNNGKHRTKEKIPLGIEYIRARSRSVSPKMRVEISKEEKNRTTKDDDSETNRHSRTSSLEIPVNTPNITDRTIGTNKSLFGRKALVYAKLNEIPNINIICRLLTLEISLLVLLLPNTERLLLPNLFHHPLELPSCEYSASIHLPHRCR